MLGGCVVKHWVLVTTYLIYPVKLAHLSVLPLNVADRRCVVVNSFKAAVDGSVVSIVQVSVWDSVVSEAMPVCLGDAL